MTGLRMVWGSIAMRRMVRGRSGRRISWDRRTPAGMTIRVGGGKYGATDAATERSSGPLSCEQSDPSQKRDMSAMVLTERLWVVISLAAGSAAQAWRCQAGSSGVGAEPHGAVISGGGDSGNRGGVRRRR